MSNKQHEHMIIGMCFCLNTISLIFIYIYIFFSLYIYIYIYTIINTHENVFCAIPILLLRDVRPRHPGLELLLSLGQQALAEVLRDLVVGQGPELRPGQL